MAHLETLGKIQHYLSYLPAEQFITLRGLRQKCNDFLFNTVIPALCASRRSEVLGSGDGENEPGAQAARGTESVEGWPGSPGQGP